MTQSYDGDGLRVKKTENGNTTYYLRSTVLGGQVVAEINSGGGWTRGYVYQGGSLLAVQQGGVYWMHQDPVTKSQRVTDVNGTVVSTVELDPWGGNTNRSSNDAFQPHRFTSYERDLNASDEAMHRRYNRWHSRFDQPDPYDGSYNPTDPQSFNRYAYTQNDPVNFVDPTGLSDHGPRLPGPPPPSPPPQFLPNLPMTFFVTVTAGSDPMNIGGGFGGGDMFLLELRAGDEGIGLDGGGGGGGGAPGQKKKDTGPPLKPLDPKDIQRRMAEGQAWDKWQTWNECAHPIWGRYQAQLNNVRRFFGPGFSRDLGAGFGVFTAIFADLNPIGVTASVFIVWGTINQDRSEVYDIINSYKSEVTKKCGPQPPHP